MISLCRSNIIKSILSLILIIICTPYLYSIKRPENNKFKDLSNNYNWTLDWIENFNDNKIDTLIWSIIPRGIYDWNNTMSYDKRCTKISNGRLILKGIINDNLQSDTSKYLTGGIFTKYKKNFKPGKFEFRIKLNGAEGAWPAIWLRPFYKGKNFPYDGEIDILEHLNHDCYVYQTVHSYYITKLRNKTPLNQKKAPINKKNFNVYGVEILEDSIVFRINGIKTHSYPNLHLSKEYDQFPFFKEWFIILSMQIGGSWVGKVNDNDLPVEMEIDWIKHYSIND